MSTHYFIKSKLNNNVIDIKDSSKTAGASLDSYPQKSTDTDNQLWEFEADPAGSGYYFIKSKLNGNVIDIEGALTTAGALLDAYTQKSTNTDNQLWQFVVDPAGTGYYFIQSKLNGNVIDIEDSSTTAGASLDSYPQKSTGTVNQLWNVCDTKGNLVLPPPQPAFTGGQSMVSLSNGTAVGAMIGFSNGHVYLWSGSWADLGTPPDSQSTCLSALFLPSLNELIAFVVGGNGHLYDTYYSYAEGASPVLAWQDQGTIPASVTPSGSAVDVASGAEGNPVMVSSVYQTTSKQIFAFVIGMDQNLYDCHLAGTTWVWEAHGAPSTTKLLFLASPSAAIYDASTDQIFVFIVGEDGNLWDRHGSGTTWSWYDHGVPTGSPTLSLWPCVVFQPATGEIFVFVTAGDGHLYCRNWNGLAWLWSDLGMPSGTTAGSTVAAICDPSSNQIYAFVVGSGTAGGDLYMNHWNGTTWGGLQDTGFSTALGVKALNTPGYLSAVYPSLAGYKPSVLVNQANDLFPLAQGILNTSTDKWSWTTVGKPFPDF